MTDPPVDPLLHLLHVTVLQAPDQFTGHAGASWRRWQAELLAHTGVWQRDRQTVSGWRWQQVSVVRRAGRSSQHQNICGGGCGDGEGCWRAAAAAAATAANSRRATREAAKPVEGATIDSRIFLFAPVFLRMRPRLMLSTVCVCAWYLSMNACVTVSIAQSACVMCCSSPGSL